MKILISTPLYPPEVGGPATYTALLERELPMRGFEVDVLKFSDVKHRPFFIRHIIFFFKLLRHGRNADVFFAQDPLGVGLPTVCAGFVLRKKSVVKIVGDRAWEEYQTQNAKRKTQNNDPKIKIDLLDEFQNKRYGFGIEARRTVQKFVARRADRIIVPSAYLKKILVDGWKIDGEKIEIVHNAFEAPTVTMTRDEARKILGISGILLVSAGRLVAWKGFETLIEIMPDIVEQFPDAMLYVIGDGPERKNLELQIKNDGLENHIILTGRVSHDDSMLYLTAADAFVLNTGYEGLSHQILEAMAVGTPVVTTHVGGNPELIDDGVSGRLVSYNNEAGLIGGIAEVLGGEEIRRSYSDEALKKAQEFSKEKMLVSLTRIFKTI